VLDDACHSSRDFTVFVTGALVTITLLVAALVFGAELAADGIAALVSHWPPLLSRDDAVDTSPVASS
jgi:hypothetical protein